jgi:hypothetical protein
MKSNESMSVHVTFITGSSTSALVGGPWYLGSELYGATLEQAIAKTLAKRSAYQILSVIILFVIMVLKV